jgi:hypothetical protein
VVNVEVDVNTNGAAPTGNVFVRAVKSENGVVSATFGLPVNVSVGVYLTPTTLTGTTPNWHCHQTRLFTVASGATVQFGGELDANGTFTAATSSQATIVYSCQ